MSFKKLIHFIVSSMLVAAVFTSAACNKSSVDASEADKNNQTKPEAEEPAEKQKKAQEDQPAKADGQIQADIYPDFNFGVFSQDERSRFVDVAKAELCPCPGSAVSLHECLQDRQKRCGLAQSAAQIVGSGIKQGLNQTDVLDKVAEHVEAARKEYDFDLSDTPYKGSPDAPVKIVEFADFQCPFCREAARIMDAAHDKYGDKVVIYYRHFPLSAHPEAEVAARAAVAAQMQDKFWPMHDLLFKYQKQLSAEKIDQFARQIGVNFSKFKKDMTSAEAVKRVRADKQAGEDAQITGTPSIFINGRRYMGDRTEDAIFGAIERSLENTTTDQK